MRQPVIITRPAEEAKRTAVKVEKAGFAPVIFPVLQARLLEPSIDLSKIGALMVTSPQGLKWLEKHSALHGFPLYVVGNASAALAQKIGLEKIFAGNGGAQELCELILNYGLPAGKSLLYLRGEIIHFNAQKFFSAHMVPFVEHTVYKMAPCLTLDEKTRQFLAASPLGFIFFYSLKTAKTFISLWPASMKPLLQSYTAICLSRHVAQSLPATFFKEIHWAPEPKESYVLDLLNHLSGGRITPVGTKHDGR